MFYRITLFIPYVLPGVVVAQTWRYLMNPLHGIGALLSQLGIRGGYRYPRQSKNRYAGGGFRRQLALVGLSDGPVPRGHAEHPD